MLKKQGIINFNCKNNFFQGMPHMENEKICGDMIILFNVVIPSNYEFEKEDSDQLLKILKK